MTETDRGTTPGGRPVTHGSLVTSDGRHALRFERTFAHSIERVWRAVSVPAELERWFPAAVDWTPAVGETFEAGGATLEVTQVDPPRRLAWIHAGQPYGFELTAEGDGCRLVFTHVVDDLTISAQAAAGWEAYLSMLEPHLDGEHVSEAVAHERWAEIHERYAELFEVDPTPGRQFAAALRSGQ